MLVGLNVGRRGVCLCQLHARLATDPLTANIHRMCVCVCVCVMRDELTLNDDERGRHLCCYTLVDGQRNVV